MDTGRLDTIRHRVRASGRRWTLAKGAIVETLIDVPSHLSVQQIHQQISHRYPGIDPSTIYRALTTLTEDHIVHTLDQPGEARYGLADHPHHHARCLRCGRQAEIPAVAVQHLLDAARDQTGFHFAGHSLTLTGLCQPCTAT